MYDDDNGKNIVFKKVTPSSNKGDSDVNLLDYRKQIMTGGSPTAKVSQLA